MTTDKQNQNLAPCETDTNEIEYIVCHVGLLWRRLVNAKIKSLGICGTEKRVLFCVSRNPGWTQVQVANFLDLEPQNIIRTLDKLEQKGWIEKRPAPQDRRAKCLFITTVGSKMIQQIKAVTDSLKPQVISGLSEQNIQIIVTHLSVMRENLFAQLASEDDSVL